VRRCKTQGKQENAHGRAWPHGLLDIPIGTFNTWVLITSSVTVVLAWSALKVNNFKRFRFFMVITVICALSFLSIKSYEYNGKFTHYYIKMKSGEAFAGHMEVEGHHQGFWNFSEMWDLDKLVHDKVTSFKVLSDLPKDPAHPGLIEKEVKTADVQVLGAFIPKTHPFFAIYFLITALHGLHVLAGAIVLFYFAFPGAKMWKTQPEQFINRIEVGGLFWHFVDLVWIFLFPVVYLL
jgi:cytochrome c oxidase subunit 3